MFSGPDGDRQLIRERYGAYSDAVFQQNREDWLACWSDGGVWHLFDETISGKDALGKQWETLWSALERMAFFTELGSTEIYGDRARTRCYCHEIVEMKGGDMMKVVGLYDDHLVKQSGDWLFAERHYSVLIRE